VEKVGAVLVDLIDRDLIWPWCRNPINIVVVD
jgi:hypothetical protein